MIRALIFDCFGVLYQGSLGHLYELTPPKQHQELADLSKASDYGYLDHETYVHRVSQLSGKSTAAITAIMQADHIRNQSAVDLITEYAPMYKIGLLSNVGKGVMENLFTITEQKTLFDSVVLSSEVNLIKPDPAIFQLMASRLNCRPDECIMIDDLASNIAAATNIGMKGVVFKTTQSCTTEIQQIIGLVDS